MKANPWMPWQFRGHRLHWMYLVCKPWQRHPGIVTGQKQVWMSYFYLTSVLDYAFVLLTISFMIQYPQRHSIHCCGWMLVVLITLPPLFFTVFCGSIVLTSYWRLMELTVWRIIPLQFLVDPYLWSHILVFNFPCRQ